MNPTKRDRVTVGLKWFHQAQFAGYYLAQEQGFYRSEALEVEIRPGGPDADPERLVASGGVDFAQAGGIESVLAARADGLPVVAIGAVFQKIDVVFIAKRETGITRFEDFAGRRVSTWYTGVQLILRGLLRQAGLDSATIVEVPQASSMEPFLRDEVAVATATRFNQLPQLRSQGMPDLAILDPADHGLIFPRDVIIASERTVAERPELVGRFLRASLRGWRFAVANQSEAVEAVMRQDPQLDRSHQAVMLRQIAKLMLWGPGTTQGIGYIDPEAVKSAQGFLLRNGQIARPVAPDQAATMRFWQPV